MNVVHLIIKKAINGLVENSWGEEYKYFSDFEGKELPIPGEGKWLVKEVIESEEQYPFADCEKKCCKGCPCRFPLFRSHIKKCNFFEGAVLMKCQRQSFFYNNFLTWKFKTICPSLKKEEESLSSHLESPGKASLIGYGTNMYYATRYLTGEDVKKSSSLRWGNVFLGLGGVAGFSTLCYVGWHVASKPNLLPAWYKI